MSTIKNVIIIGATGSVGAPILTALLAEPSFKVTILSRTSSKAKLPENVPVIKVSDAFSVEELTEAFKGQDAVVGATSTGAVTTDGLALRIVDAAVAAGVKRLIPSEYGTNNLSPKARKYHPVYNAKGEALEYLQKKAAESNGKLTWTSISCGSWLDWALNPAQSGNFLKIDVKARTAVIYDSGDSRLAITTAHNTGLGVARALLNPAVTENKQIFLADFIVSPNDIVSAVQKATGEKFAIEHRQSAQEIKELRQRLDAGDVSASFPLLTLSFLGDVDVGVEFDKEGLKIWNGELGLPENTLEAVVKEAVELAARS
ncbi:hypothetical protein B0J11DRAFT_243724 [Dendryphion nanum]|uniref:NmrA-like domain-containing protein n=1 Tax=Dendryphion nanum TaxID=256645 RepID=A0A9P9E2X6_9PLEO|nr:hypothetical protein B0J11DRAFT_243724 [Dendryphion nanum]